MAEDASHFPHKFYVYIPVHSRMQIGVN
jgi:hypothetical protein